MKKLFFVFSLFLCSISFSFAQAKMSNTKHLEHKSAKSETASSQSGRLIVKMVYQHEGIKEILSSTTRTIKIPSKVDFMVEEALKGEIYDMIRELERMREGRNYPLIDKKLVSAKAKKSAKHGKLVVNVGYVNEGPIHNLGRNSRTFEIPSELDENLKKTFIAKKLKELRDALQWRNPVDPMLIR